ncbi:MAG: hypothetical protein FWE60_05735 [Oscillospiraceae bacterium]|nr:hypothetical protein [Oscillospiraceae bacterium]
MSSVAKAFYSEAIRSAVHQRKKEKAETSEFEKVLKNIIEADEAEEETLIESRGLIDQIIAMLKRRQDGEYQTCGGVEWLHLGKMSEFESAAGELIPLM